MPSEAYRGFLRICCNYGRLGSTLLIGIIYVPIFLLWLGEEGFGLYTLMGASVGIAAIANDVSRKSMLRELAAAHHGGDASWFRSIYNSAFVVSLAAAGLTLIGFLILLTLLPLLRIPEELTEAARWLVVAEGVVIFTRIMLQPTLNMYAVHERFFFSNLWIVLRRLVALISALALFYGFQITDPASALKAYAVTNASAQLAVIGVATVLMVILDRRLVLKPWSITGPAVREIVGTFSMQAMVTLAMSMHEKIGQLIVNVLFGVTGNMIYGVGLRLSSYARMATMGVTGGMETVSARIGADESRTGAVANLLHHTTRLHAFVTVPAGLCIFILAEPLITLWVGRALQNPEQTIPLTVAIVQILMFALASRSISDGWIAVLYGTGHIKRYAPLVLTGGVLNPILTIGLVYTLPEAVRFNAPAIAFAVILTVLHLLMLPVVASRCFSVPYIEIVRPMLRPAIVAFAGAPILVWGQAAEYSLVNLLLVMGAYLGYYAVASWLFTMSAGERRRFSGALVRRVNSLRPV